MGRSSKVTTPEFRVSYPNVLKPKLNKLSGQSEYSLVALFPKGADLSKLIAAAKEAMEEEWGSDKAKHPKNLRTPFRDQAEKEKDGTLPSGHEAGAIFINLKSKQRPGVIDRTGNDILEESDFYAGCFAHATVVAYTYDNAGNKGVSFGLQNIQKLKEGEPLGGRTKPQNDFAPIEGAVKASATDLFN